MTSTTSTTSRSAPLRLPPNVHLNVAYHDRTRTGSPVGDRPVHLIREVAASVADHVSRHGYASLVTQGPRLLEEVVTSPQFRAFADVDRRSFRHRGWKVADEVLYPDAALAPPRQLTVACTDTNRMARAVVPLDYWPELHDHVAALDGGGLRLSDIRDDDLGRFVAALVEEGLVVPADDAGDDGHPDGTGPGRDRVTFLGHNTVVVRSSTSSVMVDPLLFAQKQQYPAGYQPLGLRHVGSPDAVLITHTHRDHVDAASLLRLPRHTRVVVPAIERETILTTDLQRRLGELGFTDVVPLEWGARTQVGDIEVHALPFYGEQPTDGDVLHPEIRNEGNTYLVRSPGCSAVFLADAGRDGSGSMYDVAAHAQRRLGSVDAVFVGYRGWITYPAQMPMSSVGQFLWFVPPWLWGSRLQLMLDPDDAVDLAERFRARYVVPYADGGAPWHWAIGLGPVLDGSGDETLGFDLFPERVVEACRRRVQFVDGTDAASPVLPLLMRPGDTIAARDLQGPGAVTAIQRIPGHAWPW